MNHTTSIIIIIVIIIIRIIDMFTELPESRREPRIRMSEVLDSGRLCKV